MQMEYGVVAKIALEKGKAYSRKNELGELNFVQFSAA